MTLKLVVVLNPTYVGNEVLNQIMNRFVSETFCIISQDAKTVSAGMKTSTGLPSSFRNRSKQRSNDAWLP